MTTYCYVIRQKYKNRYISVTVLFVYTYCNYNYTIVKNVCLVHFFGIFAENIYFKKFCYF